MCQKKIIRYMCYALRHRQDLVLDMIDSDGWADVSEVIACFRQSRLEVSKDDLLDAVIEDKNKYFEFDKSLKLIRVRKEHLLSGDMVTVATFTHPESAHITKGLLEDAGIPVHINNENIVSANIWYSNAVGGVQVQVSREFAKAANAILNPDKSSEESKDPDIEDIIECPACKSICTKTRTKVNVFHRLRNLILGWIFSIPAKPRTEYVCLDCGYKWLEY